MADRTAPTSTVRVRTTAARVVQVACTVIAVVTALAAVTVALRSNVNPDNVLVEFMRGIAGFFDGPFSRENGVFDFSGDSAVTRNALVNWGIAAVVWAALGRVLSGVIRP